MVSYILGSYICGIIGFIGYWTFLIYKDENDPEYVIPAVCITMMSPIIPVAVVVGGTIYSIAFTIAKHMPSVKDE